MAKRTAKTKAAAGKAAKGGAEKASAAAAPDGRFVAIKGLLSVVKVAHAAKEWPAATAGVLLQRRGNRQVLAATNGLVLLEAVTDRRLEESGGDASFVLPRPLVEAVLKTAARPQAAVQIDCGKLAVLAELPDGTKVEARRHAGGEFPGRGTVGRPPAGRGAVRVKVAPDLLAALLRTIMRAGSGVESVTLHATAKSHLLWVTAADGEADFFGVVAGADVVLPGIPTSPRKAEGDGS